MGVKLVLDPPDNRIKIGMYCRVKLITESKADVVAIPRSAILTRSGQDTVFVVNGGAVELRPITVGITVDDMVEVVSGLVSGNEIVMSGQTLLDSGSKVNLDKCSRCNYEIQVGTKFKSIVHVLCLDSVNYLRILEESPVSGIVGIHKVSYLLG